ncbi:MAG TPA: hypothetical protein VHG08_01780 [Longimicrobium sp.]|nr:hypothetical protein [Longimicrobium sp.]
MPVLIVLFFAWLFLGDSSSSDARRSERTPAWVPIAFASIFAALIVAGSIVIVSNAAIAILSFFLVSALYPAVGAAVVEMVADLDAWADQTERDVEDKIWIATLWPLALPYFLVTLSARRIGKDLDR